MPVDFVHEISCDIHWRNQPTKLSCLMTDKKRNHVRQILLEKWNMPVDLVHEISCDIHWRNQPIKLSCLMTDKLFCLNILT